MYVAISYRTIGTSSIMIGFLKKHGIYTFHNITSAYYSVWKWATLSTYGIQNESSHFISKLQTPKQTPITSAYAYFDVNL